ncbi:23S rRNA (adenine2503-C2)-methyltransferase [Fistulifera solaris]|uniref:23S rRNA (Adenine2503-C2)-methyltransferase n=1 Tax=Fistulifera solaris TaxID=1519565 RepID=A0A1Z5KFT6_FISSO|nr:23S rRNA (adenine2503-C2)-methyltransferase [Fistulifera solaris]|eukprot:GAX25077.1 23S rRNA (adenine2503-C2)-methyltransferase [Fistulifera solaris]
MNKQKKRVMLNSLLCIFAWNVCIAFPFAFGLNSATPRPSSTTPLSPLSLTLDELSLQLGGKGRAQACWEAYRSGTDPILGTEAQQRLLQRPPDVATLHHQTTCHDGTTKLLLQLPDNLQVETVIIPWPERQRSTVCISSQVGCRQACTFCLTGRMGLLRNLSCDEIVSQVYWAQRVVKTTAMLPIENVVFMGLGEPADNVDAVVAAAECLTDPHRFAMTPRRVTISTVAPTPDAFAKLNRAPAVLAWSVHATRDALRKQLVPTTKYSMTELREGLVSTLEQRSKRRRNILLEITLLDQINDSIEDAQHLVEFCQPLVAIPGVRVIVNLIPWNDIQVQTGAAAQYRKPSPERIEAFQHYLIQQGNLRCFIRTTRGDDELAACGQLSTRNRS